MREFLEAWWVHSLTDPDPLVAACEVLALCVEASGALSPWLKAWEALTHPVAGQRLAEAAARWEDDLLRGELPWDALEDNEDKEDKFAELTAWVVRHAPARLRAHGASEEVLHRIRLLGLSGPTRWDDPHWPN